MGRAGRISWKRELPNLALAAAILCVPAVAERVFAHARQHRVDEEATRKAREAAELARQALALQADAVAMMAENAVANPRFAAALRGRVDRGTFTDLLATEAWWEPYRGLLTAISYDGETLAFAQTDGANGVPVEAIVS